MIKRVGHKGADLLAPGNTLPSFDAALAAGVDMIEFDVLPGRANLEPGDDAQPLILAHDYKAAAQVTPPTLDEGLAHLTSAPFASIDLDVDIKLPGYERRVFEALREFGVLDRCIVACQYTSSLAAFRQLSSELKLGWSVPRASRDYLSSPLSAVPALAALRVLRAVLPRRALAALRERRCNAMMVHWRLVSPRLVRAVRAGDGELYAWTVDDAERIRELSRLGVTGVITNDPRLFDAART